MLIQVLKSKIHRVTVTESNLLDYPGLNFYRHEGETDTLRSWQAGVPKELQGNRRRVRVKTREPYLAKTKGARAFPWRVFVLADNYRYSSKTVSCGNDAAVFNQVADFFFTVAVNVKDLAVIFGCDLAVIINDLKIHPSTVSFKTVSAGRENVVMRGNAIRHREVIRDR